MNLNSRLEYRYFFEVGQEQCLCDYLDMFPELSRISFPNPVTQTLYFTQGKAGRYAVPERKIVRIRKYSNDKFIFLLENEAVHLEVKIFSGDWNSKERITLPGRKALELLSKKERLYISEKTSDMPPLFPTVGTSSVRNHWVHKSGLRITLDDEIVFFVFNEETGQGLLSEMCSEGKIEFKFPKSEDKEIDFLLPGISQGLVDCVERKPNYLEGRLRQCFFQKLKH